MYLINPISFWCQCFSLALRALWTTYFLSVTLLLLVIIAYLFRLLTPVLIFHPSLWAFPCPSLQPRCGDPIMTLGPRYTLQSRASIALSRSSEKVFVATDYSIQRWPASSLRWFSSLSSLSVPSKLTLNLFYILRCLWKKSGGWGGGLEEVGVLWELARWRIMEQCPRGQGTWILVWAQWLGMWHESFCLSFSYL